jgi:hypothetical protein
MATLEDWIHLADDPRNDKEKVESGKGVPCRICWKLFRRLRVTWRHCGDCGCGLCEGEHGISGRCVQCCPPVVPEP